MNFLCGEYFKSLCDFCLDEKGFNNVSPTNRLFKEPLIFVKTDYISQFQKFYLKEPVRIITHNSDNCIDYRHLDILDNSKIIHWYAQNVNINHAKLTSIPIGIANPIWPHGNQKIIKNTINKKNNKTNLVYANFTVDTNPEERIACLNAVKKNNIEFENKVPFESYLDRLSCSMFSTSPNGNGIDCHKTWESLYLKTIPIVTDSINASFYKNLPILLINSWDDFDIKLLSFDLYKKIINKPFYNLEKTFL